MLSGREILRAAAHVSLLDRRERSKATSWLWDVFGRAGMGRSPIGTKTT